MINKIILVFIALITTLAADACKCATMTFAEEWQNANQVFIGIPVKKEIKNLATYTFVVKENFKGNASDSIVILTGIGGGDCGMSFVIGSSYIIYANDGHTNRCRRNALAADNPDLNQLRVLADASYASKIATDNSPVLTPDQASYINTELSGIRKTFDFSEKKVGFLYNNKLVGKQTYFKEQAGRDAAYQLVILDENERQQSNGYDAIIVFWRKLPVSNKLKKRLIRELKNTPIQ